MAAKGFQERVLIPALRKQGLSVREARAAIDAVLGSIKDALGLHEYVEAADWKGRIEGLSEFRPWDTSLR
jgi:hypothetical protein